MRIVLELTQEEADKLSEAVDFHQDMGPTGEGWASNLLESVRAKVEEAIAEAREGSQQ
jgi:hypothetical protein